MHVNHTFSHLHQKLTIVSDGRWCFEFRDQKLERSAGLTAADRKWTDTIVTDVNESWDEKISSRPTGMHQCVISTRYIYLKKRVVIYL